MADYRPVPGKRLFVSAHGNRPRIIKALEYFRPDVLTGEQLKYVRGDGTEGHYAVKHLRFYPDVPLDTKYLYKVQASSSADCSTEDYELGYFFKPEEAFHRISYILAGEVKLPRALPNIYELDFSVIVEEV